SARRRASRSTTRRSSPSSGCCRTTPTWRRTCGPTSTGSPTTCGRCSRSSTSATRSASSKLDESGLLFLVLEKFKNIDLHPDKVSNLEMGYVFEELLRKFNEAMDENPGEHFTPREVVRLMVALILSHDREALHQPGIVRTVSDPCS